VKDILAKSFDSAKAIRAMFESLREAAPEVSWSKRDSEQEGLYIKGVTDRGVRLKVLEREQGYSLEIYFPRTHDGGSTFSAAEKASFLDRIEKTILPAAGAENVADED